jgi:hypothetical protein
MIYEYECQICKHRTTATRSIAERNYGPDCCNGKMEKRIFSATMFTAPEWNVDYFCPALGMPISSMRQRQYEMDKGGLADAREFPEPDFEAMAQEAQDVQTHAATKPEVPLELQDAMKREGLGDML